LVLQGAALTLLRVAGAEEAALLLYRDDAQHGRSQPVLEAALRRHGINLRAEVER
jgi:hypothetical protein